LIVLSPEPEPDHAVVMARFARDSLEKMGEMLLKLAVTLGPDTTDLAMRVGLHSGPVTAGVLRGERARFQLFGDTVNTAARMESTGIRTKIQISQETAQLIIASGKSQWIKPREDIVVAKGKGELKTYWLLPKNLCGASTYSTYSPSECGSEAEHVESLELMTAQEEGSEHSSHP
jgi:class 3 adenylate cyclase